MDISKLDRALGQLAILENRLYRNDAEFSESDHPRDENGKFSSSESAKKEKLSNGLPTHVVASVMPSGNSGTTKYKVSPRHGSKEEHHVTINNADNSIVSHRRVVWKTEHTVRGPKSVVGGTEDFSPKQSFSKYNIHGAIQRHKK